MRIQQLLEHHHVARNPFAEEDAQTDPVFKEYCIASIHHPTWDKVYGDPAEPSTSVVFGERGSGKTAMRLQIARHLEQYNREHPARRVYLIPYDDFNPFLDRFRERAWRGKRRADRVLAEWKLWDHMDAILTLGVTALVDQLLGSRGANASKANEIDPRAIERLDRHQRRDLLLLAAFYDQSTAETYAGRWNRLRQLLRFPTWIARWRLALGLATTLGLLIAMISLAVHGHVVWIGTFWYLPAIGLAVGWCPWLWRAAACLGMARGVRRHVRVGNHETAALRQVLMRLTATELSGQPIPCHDSTDSRYELLFKLQSLLQTLGFHGITVLVDRVDEPHLINGSAELMKMLVWPLLDNKFLKHPGMGIKLMLPIELTRFIEREDRDFYQRARLDKQNMISSFVWSGEALYDVANARLEACAQDGAKPVLKQFFDNSVSEQRLIEILRSLRVPRQLFKFLHRLFVAHCNAHTDQAPVWKISSEMLEATLAVSLRDQDAFDRGVGAG